MFVLCLTLIIEYFSLSVHCASDILGCCSENGVPRLVAATRELVESWGLVVSLVYKPRMLDAPS